MSEPSKNERVRECTTSEYPKDESTNEETRTTRSKRSGERERSKQPKKASRKQAREKSKRGQERKKASHHAHPPEHERARRTHQDRHAHESVASDGLDERSEDRTERAY